MKQASMKLLCLFGAFASVASAHAADLAGKWTGKMALDGTTLKKQLKEQSAKLTGANKKRVEDRIKTIDESIQTVDKTKVKLDLKKGGVAFVEFNRNGKAEPEWCKWTVKGKKITLFGFSGQGNSTMTLDGTIADSGKSLIFDMSSMIAQQMNSQGLKAASIPKLTLTFKKS